MKVVHFTTGYEYGGGSLAVKTLHESLLINNVDSHVISQRLVGAYRAVNRSEVRAKLDEILAFAGVEKFADTPVKRFFLRHVCAAGIRGGCTPGTGNFDSGRSSGCG